MLAITNYLRRTNSWEKLRDYILDIAKITVSAGEDPSDLAIAWFKNQAMSLITQKDLYDLIDKKIRNYRLGAHNPDKRGGFTFTDYTLYPLLFVLGIKDPMDIQRFCRNTLHQDELSARNLKDFITLCCLKLNCPVDVYASMISKYSEEIKNMESAPRKVLYGVTGDHFDSISSINNTNQLERYVQDHLSEFAKTRNTRYLMLFDEVGWESWGQDQWKDFFNQYPDYDPGYWNMSEADRADFILDVLENGVSPSMEHDLIKYWHHDEFDDSQRKDAHNEKAKRKKTLEQNKTPEDCYNRFHLCENGLTDEQIGILSKADDYKDAFLSSDAYKKLFFQKATNDIPAGVYLISMLMKYFEDTDAPEDKFRPTDIKLYEKSDGLLDSVTTIGRDRFFTTTDSFIDECNQELALGGFPPLNKYNLFNKLFIDTYEEVRLERPTAIYFVEIQEMFIHRLCHYLKEVADYLSQTK